MDEPFHTSLYVSFWLQLEVRARLEDTKLLIEKDETLSEVSVCLVVYSYQ